MGHFSSAIAYRLYKVMGVRTIVPCTPGDALFWAGREVGIPALLANTFLSVQCCL